MLAVPALAAGQQSPAPAAAPPVSQAPLAQVPAAPAPLTRQQKAALAQQDAEIVHAARQVMALVDAGRIDEVWNGASPTIKRMVAGGEFAMQVKADRERLGAVRSRDTPSVTRERYAAGSRVPQGEYLNVAIATHFANAPQPVRELVSFRLDEDRVWRVSGYSVR